MNTLISWIIANWIELIGVITGLLYLFFSIRQIIWVWPLGILTSAFYIVVFFDSGFYADMSMQVYYLAISFYGWYFWIYGKGKQEEVLPVSRITRKAALWSALIFVILFVVIGLVLDYYTPSVVPWWDSGTTAASIVATWMLARKIIEHWLVWVVVDAVSMGLYMHKGLYLTVFLFLVYTLLAVVGYVQWKKSMINS